MSAARPLAAARNPLISHEVGARIEHTVRRVLSEPSDCVPHATVMLSSFNEHHQALQRLHVHAVSRMRCLTSRMVFVCFGAARTKHGTCVYAPAVAPSDFGVGSYQVMTWSKYSVRR